MNLIAYCRDETKHPNKEMFAAGAFWDQILFVRDVLAPCIGIPRSVACNEELGDENPVTVVGSHRSKSIDFPVYRLDGPRMTVVLRNNLHQWTVTVLSRVGPIESDVTDLIGTESGAYMGDEGMAEWIHPVWPKSREAFSFSVTGNYRLYTTMFLLNRVPS